MEPFIVPKRKRCDSMSMVSSMLKIDRVEILIYCMKRVFVAGDGQRQWQGLLDEFIIFNTVLDEKDI